MADCMCYGLRRRLSPSLFCQLASVEMSHDVCRLIAGRADTAQAHTPMTSSFRSSFFRFVSRTVQYLHTESACAGLCRNLCRFTHYTHPSSLACLLNIFTNFIVLSATNINIFHFHLNIFHLHLKPKVYVMEAR